MIRTVTALCFACALAGCTAFSAPRPGTAGHAAAQESRQVTELIGYTHKVAALRADEQRRELNASNQMLSKNRDAYSRMRLALLLALPGTAFNDDSRAVSLLEPLAGNSEPGPMQQFAGLMYSHVSERLREQRRSAQLKEQLEAMKAVERNAAQLKEQLDAMRAIERKLLERELGRPR
jgi:hypothetical protein